jgi:hypothetical protein
MGGTRPPFYSNLQSIWAASLAYGLRTGGIGSRKFLIPLNIYGDHLTLHS